MVKNIDEAFKVEEKYKDKPYGWIQWKGTDVCMDIHCECGELFHIDGDFAYAVECPYCGTMYSCNGHIELIKIEERPHHIIKGD